MKAAIELVPRVVYSSLIFYATEEALSTATHHVTKQQLQQAAAAQASFSCLVAPFKNLALT
jgi:hypothetical protein